jgi:hypothetical protein
MALRAWRWSWEAALRYGREESSRGGAAADELGSRKNCEGFGFGSFWRVGSARAWGRASEQFRPIMKTKNCWAISHFSHGSCSNPPS